MLDGTTAEGASLSSVRLVGVDQSATLVASTSGKDAALDSAC